MVRRWAALLLCLLAAVLALAACGGDSASKPSTTVPAGSAAPSATAVKDPTAGGYVAKLKALTVPPDLTRGRTLGSAEAKVTLEMFEDFRCIHCLEFTGDFEQFIVDTYVKTGKVQVQFRYFPLSQSSLPMMAAAECASQQEQFWPYATKLFLVQAESYEGGPKLQEAFSEAKLKDYAAELGFETAQFATCYGTDSTLDAVAADYREVQALSLKGTPAFVVNGKLLPQNPANIAAWKSVLDAAAE